MRTARFKDLVYENEARRLLGPKDVEVGGLAYRHQDVRQSSVFVAIPGTNTDGRRFIPLALEGGASAIIAREAPPELPPGIALAEVDDPRRALARAAARFYNHPSRRIPVVGITGTNGKTTVTYILESIWRAAGHCPAVIGTVNYRLSDKTRPATVTTPESVDIERMLDEMIDEGADAAVIEVSSHALEQGRVEGLRFAARAFTNLSRDHLDYHGDIKAYFEAKARLFTDKEFADSGPAAINADDPHGKILIEQSGEKILPYGIETKLDGAVRPVEWSADIDGIVARVETPRGNLALQSRLLGQWNLYNILTSVAVAQILGLDQTAIVAGIENLERVPGRLERVENDKGVLVVVDYSHTPDSLEKALLTLRDLTKGRLIAVFGCGGDRDRGKRPIMGKLAAELADTVVITSDNPRTEEPLTIIEEILAGIESSERVEPGKLHDKNRALWVEPDRRGAIYQAIEAARDGDTVLIAGKGHEDYQILGDKRIHFDDREVAMEALGVSSGEGAVS